MSLVSLAKIEGNNIKQAIVDSLKLLDYRFGNNLQKIVIKVNACYYWDFSTGRTTDPAFVSSLIDLIREKTSPYVDIAIVESDASAMKCKYAFKFLGFEKMAKDRKVRLVNLSEDTIDVCQVTCTGHSFCFMVPQVISHADLRINLPKIKYASEDIKLSCALKNVFGCNPYPKKFQYHPQLGKTIVNIIDGNIVSGIQPRKLGLVMASRDPVAIDVASAKIAGINPRTIKYLQLARKEGLGNTNFIPKGMPINYFKALYPKKTIKKKLMSRAYNLASRVGLGKRLGLS